MMSDLIIDCTAKTATVVAISDEERAERGSEPGTPAPDPVQTLAAVLVDEGVLPADKVADLLPKVTTP